MLRILFALLFFTSVLPAQTALSFRPILDGRVLRSGADNAAGHDGAVAGARRVEVLRWYLSDIRFLQDGTTVFTPAKRHHLLDLEAPAGLNLQLATPPGLNYDEVSFTLGVDSLTAASGAFGGDLDPTRGMYWTWRSGYINFKLEGTDPECPVRQNRFQFHVGGFQGPFASQREVTLKVSPAAIVPVYLNLDRFFKTVNVKKQYQVMSPNEASAKMADLLAELFSAERQSS
ncbi:hypothetical protein FUA23_19435 [Neolewinella aurantiaca]|uniref:Copper-binding protein MbnP-like domain-containing protein n=1 Tax=Neolewinella aurantiaca TaxID=2602767 RepID=A0A5C7FJ08_9BACT|nr:MbnP family protein [Neolewinella aurantiaca]TXF86294.1 hypothetical protein FUA23_19435 [Neolewinella aurantiaca]